MELFYKNTDINDLPNEVWIDVFGYDGLYSVSNMGRIRSEQREILIGNGNYRIKRATIMRQNIRAPHRNHQKHASVMFAVDKMQKRVEVSYIVGMSFIRPLENGEIFYHKDKNALNNTLVNIGIMKYKDAPILGQTITRRREDFTEAINNIKNRKIAEYVRKKDGKIFDYNSIKKEYPNYKDPVSNIRRSIQLNRERMGSLWIINIFEKTDEGWQKIK